MTDTQILDWLDFEMKHNPHKVPTCRQGAFFTKGRFGKQYSTLRAAVEASVAIERKGGDPCSGKKTTA